MREFTEEELEACKNALQMLLEFDREICNVLLDAIERRDWQLIAAGLGFLDEDCVVMKNMASAYYPEIVSYNMLPFETIRDHGEKMVKRLQDEVALRDPNLSEENIRKIMAAVPHEHPSVPLVMPNIEDHGE